MDQKPFSPAGPASESPVNPAQPASAPLDGTVSQHSQPNTSGPASAPNSVPLYARAFQPGASTVPGGTPPHNPYSVSSRQSESAPPEPAVGGKRRRSKRRTVLLAGGGALLLAAGMSAYVFGMYLPNRPDNVWTTGFERSGIALDSLVAEASSEETRRAYEKVQLSGSVSAKAESISGSGTVNGTFDATTTNGSLSLDYDAGASEAAKIGLDWRTKLTEGNTYPDSYVRLTGLKALGLDAFMPGIERYDQQWISIGSDYVQSMLPAVVEEAEAGAGEPLTDEEALEMVRAAANTTKEYIFTNDPAKAVVVRKQFVAKESSEGKSAFHYKASIHKDHARAYCNALVDAVMSTAGYKKLNSGGMPEAEAKAAAKQTCDDGVNDIKDTDTFDIWITADQKVIQKVRIDNSEEPGEYIEIGHTFDGGDSIPQFLRYVSPKDKVSVEQRATYDRKSKALSLTVEGKAEGTEDVQAFDFNVRLSFKPHEGEVPFEQPPASTPIQDVLESFGFDESVMQQMTTEPAMTEDIEASEEA